MSRSASAKMSVFLQVKRKMIKDRCCHRIVAVHTVYAKHGLLKQLSHFCYCALTKWHYKPAIYPIICALLENNWEKNNQLE